MRGTGDRPFRCEPTTNRKKTGKRSAPSRVDARLLLWPSLLLSPLIFFFRLDATRVPIHNWKISPTKKRHETTKRVVARADVVPRRERGRKNPRVDDARSSFGKSSVPVCGGGFWWCVARCSVLKRRLVVKYLPFSFEFFLAKRNKKTFFVPIARVFFRPTSNLAPGGETPPNNNNNASKRRAREKR